MQKHVRGGVAMVGLIDAVLDGREAPPDVGYGDRDPEAMRRARGALVRKLAREITSRRVLEAIYRVPRHLFLIADEWGEAYADRPLPIGNGQTISQPTIVAVMTEALELNGREKVLEIGTGSAYQSAVLAVLAGDVFTIERFPHLADLARRRLQALGFHNVHVLTADGYLGWPMMAPFDRVIVTAAPPRLPPALVDQLVDGGIIVAPIGEPDGAFSFGQSLIRGRKIEGALDVEDLCAVAFVPMCPGIGDERISLS
jgi:protein-L-isoaspartate(D-aspartate) O-methyltransferase